MKYEDELYPQVEKKKTIKVEQKCFKNTRIPIKTILYFIDDLGWSVLKLSEEFYGLDITEKDIEDIRKLIN